MQEQQLRTRQGEERHRRLIIALSIIIPLAVAVLFRIPPVQGYDFTFLPPVYATINGVTALLLMTSYWAIRNQKRTLHERINKTCIGLSATFLVMYIIYHMTTAATPYGGQGPLRGIYFFVLITHIALSVVVIPFVLFTFSRALAGNFERHRRLAKFTFPIWLYVALSGVVVYLMISPYYSHV
jgi:putative membrane protein